MASDPRETAVALRRFGLGLRPGDLARARDARGLLLADIEQRTVPQVDGLTLASRDQIAEAFYVFQEDQRARRAMKADAAPAAAATPPTGASARDQSSPSLSPPAAAPQPMAQQLLPQRVYREEATARIGAALAPAGGFAERLVQFWSNHFCVSAAKSPFLRVHAGLFEREAIRPHVFGRFEDLLFAVESHPAMLAYLDNQLSIGPGSPAGARRGRGLNENLAREILELHTLGVRGGYSQVDVTSLARMLTGWTIAGREGRLGAPGSFVFNPNAHEPGAQMLLGAVYGQPGLAQGRAALAALARHPATAQHIARKLARAFVADDPPPALVARLASSFSSSGGDLAALAKTLLLSDEAWSAPPSRMPTPQEFLVAAMRALGRTPEFPQIGGPLAAMGQPMWQPPGPDGFPTHAAAWTTPEGLKARVEVASAWGRQNAANVDPRTLVDEALGPLASPETRQAVSRAESKPQAIALLLMSPEFQRR